MDNNEYIERKQILKVLTDIVQEIHTSIDSELLTMKHPSIPLWSAQRQMLKRLIHVFTDYQLGGK